jgi:hypothetical protein
MKKHFPFLIFVGLLFSISTYGACTNSKHSSLVYQNIGKTDTIQVIGTDWIGDAIVVIDTLHKNICYLHSEGVSCLSLR